MFRNSSAWSAVLVAIFASLPAAAMVQPYPASFSNREIEANGTTLHVRVGGSGEAVVLLHGFGDTGDMWSALAAALAVDYQLRSLGSSAPADHGFEKMNQARDIAEVLDALHVERVNVVGHDIGNMVAFAFAERYPERTTKLVMMDAPVPGIGPWDDILKSPLLWHFRFGGKDMEKLVAGRERIYLDRFWNDFAADPSRFDEASRAHYGQLYAKPGRCMAGLRNSPRSIRTPPTTNQPSRTPDCRCPSWRWEEIIPSGRRWPT
jgi:pimeloyl-ACP methyl ester carboxylesterase